MTDLHDLELLLRSATPIILIESTEEPRVIALFAQLALRINQPAHRWSVTDGLRRIKFDTDTEQRLTDPTQALRYLRSGAQAGVYLLLDFHPYLAEPLNVRLLKEIAQGYGELPRTLVLVSYALEAPPELRHLCARCDLRLPDRNRIVSLIREEALPGPRPHPGLPARQPAPGRAGRRQEPGREGGGRTQPRTGSSHAKTPSSPRFSDPYPPCATRPAGGRGRVARPKLLHFLASRRLGVINCRI